MAFDESLNEEIKSWATGAGEGDIKIGIYRYNGKDPKIGINRFKKDRDSGEIRFGKLGRLNYEDVQFLDENWKEIIKEYNKVLEK